MRRGGRGSAGSEARCISSPCYATGKVGAGAFTGITVTAAIVTSIVLDHFGWLGLKEHAAGAWRIVGAVLMIAGVMLVAKF